MAIALGEIYERRIVGRMYGQIVMNTLHYVVTTADAAVDIFDINDASQGNWQAAILPVLSGHYDIHEYQTFLVDPNFEVLPSGLPQLQYTAQAILPGDPIADVGGVAGAVMPTFVTASIRKISAGLLAGGSDPRIFHGRFSLSGIPETYSDDGSDNRLNAASRSTIQTAVNSELNFSVGAGVLSMCIVSMVNAGGPYVSGLIHHQLVGTLQVNELLGSQISRKERFRLG